MDWARDNAGLSDKDLDTVFRNVRISMGRYPACLAKRTGEPLFGSMKKVHSDDWLDRINAEMPGRPTTQRTLTFASLAEKVRTAHPSIGSANMSSRKSVRTLPFSKHIFRLITKKFYTHSSIARDISRADIPVFSSAAIEMGGPDRQAYPAYVYNCRSSNAWEMDLALTATYFPHCGLTFAILFGCPLSVEEEIVKRLTFATAEAAHPLLMPGIFAELERSRHVHVVEATIDELETKILELDIQSDREGMLDSEVERRNQEKRSAWLDTTYLRNGLISWNTQLVKMSNHADELKTTVFKLTKSDRVVARTSFGTSDGICEVSSSLRDFKASGSLLSKHSEVSDFSCDGSINPAGDGLVEKQPGIHGEHTQGMGSGKEFQGPPQVHGNLIAQQRREVDKEHMRWVGDKIKYRIQGISDEYDDKIRDCTMRVDGMAMATQWAQGETTVEIALATGRESKHMRSIALVTMVFLPGTFFAVKPLLHLDGLVTDMYLSLDRVFDDIF
ncbi:uncharacterized protein BP5553_06833 [Venustampulla echinocandica]|uniref:Uncharacterized protein n=1 Tax=Venustampulla echinocandica TaxID=2656787 RepID=A0A370TL21_9HELO|nr:uncharacterized protein BP5553_06833 [Venustampulla echinocandica]RDL36221.1 hypothetical protein BP5553_06833 [Venustampulla echinocandica]